VRAWRGAGRHGVYRPASGTIAVHIGRSVAATIEPHLLAAEGVRALSGLPDDLDAWDLVARAQTHVWRMTPADNETAVTALRRAVEVYRRGAG
jgi:hypothetical protein